MPNGRLWTVSKICQQSTTREESKFKGAKKSDGSVKRNERDKDSRKESCKYCDGKHKKDKKHCPSRGAHVKNL